MSSTRLSSVLRNAGFALGCLACILVTHQLAVYLHEYAHSFMAFALGYKSEPLVIHFGSTRLVNLLLLIEIDEYVDYAPIFAHGAGWAAALIAFAGPGLGNGIPYLLSLFLLRRTGVRGNACRFLAAYWFGFMNVANFFDYVPIRIFAPTGDIAHIAQGLAVSPWTVLVVLGIPTAVAMAWLFARTLPEALALSAAGSAFRRAFIVCASVVIMFGYFGIAGIVGYDTVSHRLSLASLCLIPVMLIACWPTRGWVQAAMAEFAPAH